MSGTLEHYLAKIRQATSRPGKYAFRGQEDSRWRLHSAATRLLLAKSGQPVSEDTDFSAQLASYHRQRLVEPSRTRAFDIDRGHRLSDLEILAKLQHYGAATGLLDFTWSPLVALWFACQETVLFTGTVFVVNTTDTVRMERLPSDSDRTVNALFMAPEAALPQVLFWEPPYRSDAVLRIVRQHSLFLVDSPAIFETADELVQEILVDQSHKPQLIRDLERLAINRSTLFADIYGFAMLNSSRAASPQPLEPQDNLVHGNRHFQERAYSRAIAAYTRCINAVRSICEPYFLRGNAKACFGDHAGAIGDYDMAIRHKDHPFLHSKPSATTVTPNPILFMIYSNRGNGKSALKGYEGALDDYTTAIELAGDKDKQSSLYFNRANTYCDLGRFSDAVADYDRAIQLGSLLALYNKGNALVALGRFQEALRSYRTAKTSGIDSPQLEQNQWTVGRILFHTKGRQSTTRLDVIGPAGRRQIQVDLAAGSDDRLKTESPILAGSMGNAGNFGGPGQRGGEGLAGKEPMIVVIRNLDRVAEL